MQRPRLLIAVLAENTAQGRGLLGEHGLSLWIETPTVGVLFDTGQGLVLPHNAAKMGVDLGGAHAVVLSHGHYDHTGGLPHALDRAPGARLFLHPSSLVSRFGCRDGISREIGMPAPVREVVDRRQAAIAWTREPTEVAPGLFVTGPIPRRSGFEDTGGPFFLDANGTTPDGIEDDQALWIETERGLVVVLGCAHAGVVNTLDYVRALAGPKPIRAVVGGMHLASASEARLAGTVAALRQWDIAELWPCHCTGSPATARLMAAFGNRCRVCGAGSRIDFGSASDA